MKEYKFVFFDFDGTLVNTINGTKESADKRGKDTTCVYH